MKLVKDINVYIQKVHDIKSYGDTLIHLYIDKNVTDNDLDDDQLTKFKFHFLKQKWFKKVNIVVARLIIQSLPNETTLNITITPNKSVEQIVLNIKKNR